MGYSVVVLAFTAPSVLIKSALLPVVPTSIPSKYAVIGTSLMRVRGRQNLLPERLQAFHNVVLASAEVVVQPHVFGV
jgi:hypothetical protein